MYDKWKPIYSALVTDIMDQLGYRDQAMTPDIRPSRPDAFIAGPALTIDAYADTSPDPDPYGQIFAAYDQASPGDVFVIATNGEERSGLWGELLSTAAQARGVESVLTDGLVRDVRQMNAMGYHCFCKGYSPLDSAGRILAKNYQPTYHLRRRAGSPGRFCSSRLRWRGGDSGGDQGRSPQKGYGKARRGKCRAR